MVVQMPTSHGVTDANCGKQKLTPINIGGVAVAMKLTKRRIAMATIRKEKLLSSMFILPQFHFLFCFSRSSSNAFSVSCLLCLTSLVFTYCSIVLVSILLSSEREREREREL